MLVAMGAGLGWGLLQHALLPDTWNEALVTWLLDPLGQLFLKGIRLLVVPLVLVSLTLGTAAIGDLRRLGRIGGKIMALYLGTTAAAISLGYALATLAHPGKGLSLPADVTFAAAQRPSPLTILLDIVPENPLTAMVEGNMLQVIFVAVLAGLALASAGPRAAPLRRGLEGLDAVIQRMVVLIMLFAPFGVFGPLAKVVATQGLDVFLPLLRYAGTLLGGLGLQVLVVYSLVLLFIGRLNPLHFFRNAWPALVVAFSTASSNASLPVTLRVSEERMGTDESVHAFTLPLGATVNMDGTALMQGCATVFIAEVYGIHLTPGDFLTVVLMATLASVGTAGVPGAGLIMLSMVLQQLGLPLEGIGIILGVDRVLDMTRTAVNVAGDLCATAVVARSEGALDLARYQDQVPAETEGG
ncbi:MAG: dicarboxylate/amino acid:cation symporter [Pseudomonadota bacterium]